MHLTKGGEYRRGAARLVVALLLVLVASTAVQAVDSAPPRLARSLSWGGLFPSPAPHPLPLPLAPPSPSPEPSFADEAGPPALSTIARADVLGRIDAREVMTHAELEEMSRERLLYPSLSDRVRFLERYPPREGAPDQGRSISAYDFYVGVRVQAPVKKVREVLTDYRIYKKLIPYVDEMEFNARSRILSVQGGIWRFRIRSRIRFEEKGDRWLKFRIIGGHFRGMEGELILEPAVTGSDASTRVWVRGQSVSRLFPPEWVIEQGAQVVFTYTATRLRSFIESGRTVDQEVPELPAKPMGAGGLVMPSLPRSTIRSSTHSSPTLQEAGEKKNGSHPIPEDSGLPVPRPRRSL